MNRLLFIAATLAVTVGAPPFAPAGGGRAVCGAGLAGAKGGNPAAPTLAGQSIARAIDRAFPAEEVSYLLLDGRTGQVVASRWLEPERPIAVGSLVKPFTALAYFESHHTYPQYVCKGCWYAAGHGRVAISRAIAVSCNAYFGALTAEVSAEEAAEMARRFGIAGPSASATHDSLFGLGDDWLVAPVEVARAYLELNARQSQPGVRELIDGLESAALNGTARAASRRGTGERLLAKTGTAPCSHAPKAPGDGFAILLSDRVAPRFALLVRVHGHPGAEAAAVAGDILRIALGGRQ
jgi:hypothetical protein